MQILQLRQGSNRRASVLLAMGLLFTSGIMAQQPAQPLYSPLSRSATAMEYLALLSAYRGGLPAIQNGHELRGEARVEFIKSKIDTWLETLQANGVNGMHIDAFSVILMTREQATLAQRVLEERLATPGLSPVDQAYTLTTAIGIFTSPDKPEYLPVAKDFLQRLDRLPDFFLPKNALPQTLPDPLILAKAGGHTLFAQCYRTLGERDSALTHMNAMISMLSKVPYEHRLLLLDQTLYTYAALAYDKPRGKDIIDSVGRLMMSLAKPTPTALAEDSTSATELRRQYERTVRSQITAVSYMGKQAPPLVATHWLNSTVPEKNSAEAPNARELLLTDGKIRLIEFGTLGCSACQEALPELDALRVNFDTTQVEVWYSTNAGWGWGVTATTPEEQAQLVSRVYLKEKKLRLPIAMWSGERVKQWDGGTVEQNNPTWTAYGVEGTPLFLLVDGKGIVRHVQVGWTHGSKKIIEEYIRELLTEKNKTSPHNALAKFIVEPKESL